MPKLELYHMMSCPFCARVRASIEEQGLQSHIRYYDIDEDESAHRRLLELNDDDQVPCLVIDGEPMLESDEIISWLQEHRDSLKAA